MPITTGTAILIGSIAAASVGATVYSARQERKAAEKAASAQQETARMQIQAQKEQEILAQETATKKTKLAQARKTQTILTVPELEEVNVNQAQAIGV